MRRLLPKSAIFPIAGFVFTIAALTPAVGAQSASFDVLQSGKPVGTASYGFTSTKAG
jgi:hypothetical protein